MDEIFDLKKRTKFLLPKFAPEFAPFYIFFGGII
tara:strand:+ start:9656 stop:9757 length:102 start_codon:yes stop_codon:yes gene_type:complete